MSRKGGETVDPFIDEMSTDFFALPGLPSVGFEDDQNSFSTRDPRQMCGIFNDNDCVPSSSTTTLTTHVNSQDLGFILKRDMWVMPMLGLSAMNVLVILAFEVYVICKAAGNSPSRR